jgi:TolB protein
MEKQPKRASRIIFLLILILLAVNLALILLFVRPALLAQDEAAAVTSLPPTHSPEPTLAITIEPTHPRPTEPVAFPTLPPNPVSAEEGLKKEGVFIFAMTDGNYSHLFMYHPMYQALTRLTDGGWNDADPSVSPDGTLMAFSSQRNGYWDIYILDLTNNQLTRLTDTPQYDGKPTWSPDSKWIAFETYLDDNLEIEILSTVDSKAPPIRLTNDPASDFAPAWSPQGRELAFVSTRGGDEDVWIARLDVADNRFTNVSHRPKSRETHPAWSPDGNLLAWSSDESGSPMLVTWDSRTPDKTPIPVDSGDVPVWNPQGDSLLASIQTVKESLLAVYSTNGGQLLYPLTRIPGSIHGLQWRADPTQRLLRALPPLPNATNPAAPLWTAALSTNPMPPKGRFGVVPLPDVTVPFAYLHDAVDESFNALRQEVAKETGWDFLANLENAYVPFNEPPSPDMSPNWQFTGRAIALNTMPLNAGWMMIVREDLSGQTYWRIYLKARYQDGSQGKPLIDQPWDMNARYLGIPQDYEAGGRYHSMPVGYWIDFTDIAARYGWQRLPSQTDWRTYFTGARFNLYVITDGLDWNAAMAEIYPPEALVTPTLRPTFTPTITLTPEHFELYRLTPTPLPSQTPTFRPTFTSQPK